MIKSVIVASISAVLIGWLMYYMMLPPVPLIWLEIIFVAGGIIAVVMYLWAYFITFGIQS